MQQSGRVSTRSWVVLGIFSATALVGLGLDQTSKIWAFQRPRVSNSLVRLTTGLAIGPNAMNFGAAANAGTGWTWTPTLCALESLVVAIAGICWVVIKQVRPTTTEACVAGVLVSGMAGNAIDRVTLGYVRDFLVADALPGLIFNVADVGVLAGAFCLVFVGFARMARVRRLSNWFSTGTEASGRWALDPVPLG